MNIVAIFVGVFLAQSLQSPSSIDQDQGLLWDQFIEDQTSREQDTLREERLSDDNEDFFKTPDKNLDRNRYYFPGSTIEKNDP